MPLADLGMVTKALCKLISEGVGASDAWTTAPTVEPFAPDAMTAEGLTFYLYGVGENSTASNRAGRTADLPLGLDLHYQLVAHGGAAPATTVSMQREQLLLGLAMKVLHDHQRLEAGLIVAGVDVLGSVGIPAGNTMGITLQRLEPDQAVTWWTAGQTGVRAAAYYTVAVALLQESVPPVSGPPVLVREVFGSSSLAPYLISSNATHVLARTGEPPVTVRTSPAQVPPGGSFEVAGDGFSGQLAVAVRSEPWPDWQELGGVSLRSVDGVPTLVTVLDPMPGGRLVVPGLLRVRVLRSEERTLRAGGTKVLRSDSNETPVMVVPMIDAITTGNPHRVQGGPYAGPGIDSAGIRLTLDAEELVQVAGTTSAGEFTVVDRGLIRFRPPDGLVSGTPVRLRLLVNGAECLPTWYLAP